MDQVLTKAEKKAQRKLERQEWEEKLEQSEKQQKMKKWVLWGTIPVVLIASVFGLYKLATAPSEAPAMTAPAVTAQDIATGSAQAKITVIEYSDFQCPACAAYHPFVKQLIAEEGSKIHFIYRFFPLTQIHQNALASARFAYAASLQGKFWQVNDILFEHQSEWAELPDPTSQFMKYAQSLGLDTTKLQQDMNADSTLKFINDEEDAGTTAGVNATPTFFVNGKSITNASNYDDFKNTVMGSEK